MAANVAVNRPPPAHPGPRAANLHSQPTSGVPNTGLHDPGPQGISQDPRLQHPHVLSRPVFYVPVPPPTPFLQYQWPVPFSYNPFSGFPGMGYGMVMPPYPPPPPYMEAPPYVLPHPHIQSVDYRHLLHPPVHPPAPFQQPNQPRRVRPPHSVPLRHMVNSEVQTEPTCRGGAASGEVSPLISSDLGHGTTSNSPSSSSSSSHERGSAEPETFTRDLTESSEISAVTQRFNLVHPEGTKTLQSRDREAQQPQKSPMKSGENVPACRNGHHNMWSVGSSGSLVPVCSSSQQDDDVIKERCVSVPDILMSWVTSQTMMLKTTTDEKLPENEQLLPSSEAEKEKSSEQHRAPVESDRAAEALLASEDSEPLFKILRLPGTLQELLSEAKRVIEPSGLVELPSADELLLSLNQSERLLDNEPENETNPDADSTGLIPYQMSSNSFKRKLNESVWSVESLPPFIPNKEWLQQNGLFEPEVIVETTEQEDHDGPLTESENLRSCKDRRHSRRLSSSDSVLTSDSWLVFSTPAVKHSQSKKTETEGEIVSPDRREHTKPQSTTPSEKLPSASPPRCQSTVNVSSPPKDDADENGSSEPEANQNPNQECCLVTEQTERSCREQEKTLLSNSAEEEKTSPQLILQHGADKRACVNAEESERRNEQLCVPEVEHMAALSPSKGQLVDCGVQCSELTEQKCLCGTKSSTGPNNRPLFNDSDVKKTNNRTEGFSVNGQKSKNQRRNAHWRNRSQENQNGQWDSYGFYSKPGRSKGGNGRNTQN